MNKSVLLLLFFGLVAFLGYSQEQIKAGEYPWDKVVGIDLYVFPTSNEYCDGDNLLDKMENATPVILTDWKKLQQLLLTEGSNGDVMREKECLSILVDFGEVKIPFKVFVNQGVVFDLRKDSFYYYGVKATKLFTSFFKEYIEQN